MRNLRRFIALAAAMVLMVPALPASALPASRIDSLSFADSTTGYLSGGSVNNVGYVSVTRDGGATWHAAAFPNRWMFGVGAGASGKVLAVSDYYDRVQRSSDYGTSWSAGGAVLGSSAANFRSVGYLPSGRAILLGQRVGTGRGDLALIATSDDLSTWTSRYEGPFYAAPDEFSEPPSTISQMLAVDSAGGVAWALGNEWSAGTGADGSKITYKRPLLFRSSDSGSTWTTATATGLSNAGFAATALTALDANNAFVVGGTRAIYRTTNAGASWTNVQFQRVYDGTPAMSANAIDAIDANNVVAAGDYGVVAFTTTGGQPWTYRSNLGGNTLRGVKMFDANNWVVTGDNETILRTSDAGLSWTGSSSSQPPAVGISGPGAGFPLTATPITLSGTANDGAGVGVSGVEVRIRRADGYSWNEVTDTWVSADTWASAETADGWDHWSLSWTPDSLVRASGQIVTVSARAKDGVGNVSPEAAVSSGVPFSAAITVDGGAPYTTSLTVPVGISAPGATHMRWSVNGGAPTGWTTVSTPANVTLPAGDGTKTVTFDFSNNGGVTTLGSAEDTIVLHTSVPSVALSSPSSGFSLTGGAVSISGTASDVGGSVAGVQVLVRRADGTSWNGSSWVAGDAWQNATTSNAYANWSYSWTPDAETIASGNIVTVSARATDAAGLSATTAGVPSGVPVTASVSLAGGASYTTTTSVAAAVSATGASHMRWSVNGGAPTSWAPYSATATVTLTPSDGLKTVTFGFSADGSTEATTASDSITLHTSAPAISMTAPVANFSLQQGTVNITGTASDVGGSVGSTQVRIRRADGKSWNGSGWSAGDIWLSVTTSNAFANWTYGWTPDSETLSTGQIVTISARATDSFGLTDSTPGVSSATPITGSVSLAGGSPYAGSLSVPAIVSAPGSTHMRYRVNGGAPSAWVPYATSTTVALTSGDGTKTVGFDFSPDGSLVAASATDTIVLDQTKPTLVLGNPGPSFPINTTSRTFSGTVTDGAGTGVAGVRVKIAKAGQYWSGLAWQSTEAWLPATVVGSNWSYTWSLDAATSAGYLPVTVTAVADDVVGNASTGASVTSADPADPSALALSSKSATVAYGAKPSIVGTLTSAGAGVAGKYVYLQSSTSAASSTFKDTGAKAVTTTGGKFTFTVAPTVRTYYRVRFAATGYSSSTSWAIYYLPAASLGAPYAPTTAYHTTAFTSYGSLTPRHTAGTYPVRIFADRYEKQSNGTYKWVPRGNVYAKASNYYSYSRYTASVKLIYAGRWRMRAYHYDTGHAPTYSAYRYVTVK